MSPCPLETHPLALATTMSTPIDVSATRDGEILNIENTDSADNTCRYSRDLVSSLFRIDHTTGQQLESNYICRSRPLNSCLTECYYRKSSSRPPLLSIRTSSSNEAQLSDLHTCCLFQTRHTMASLGNLHFLQIVSHKKRTRC